MKGRYNGCTMNVYSTIPGYRSLASIPKPSKEAKQGVKWFDYYNSHNQDARLTCCYFCISPQTFYRCKMCYNPRHIESLEDCSYRPKHLRQPAYSVELVEAVTRLREVCPRRGKDKLVILLHGEGYYCSASTVGWILHKLKGRGVLKEPVPNHVSARKRQRQCPLRYKKV